MIQILLHNMKMDPLVSLHYYAPVCAIINLVFLPFTEGLAPFYEVFNVGVGVFLTNAAVAFLLNVAAVFLVGVGSGLVLTLAGVFKVRCGLIIVSSFFVIVFSSVSVVATVGRPFAINFNFDLCVPFRPPFRIFLFVRVVGLPPAVFLSIVRGLFFFKYRQTFLCRTLS